MSDTITSGVQSPLSPEFVKEQMDAKKIVVIDMRDFDSFMAGHIEGSIFGNLDLSQDTGQQRLYTESVAHLVPKKKPLVLQAPLDEEETAYKHLALHGFLSVNGYLEGSLNAWKEAGFHVNEAKTITMGELDKGKFSDETINQQVFLDIRGSENWHSKGVFPFAKQIEIKNFARSTYVPVEQKNLLKSVTNFEADVSPDIGGISADSVYYLYSNKQKRALVVWSFQGLLGKKNCFVVIPEKGGVKFQEGPDSYVVKTFKSQEVKIADCKSTSKTPIHKRRLTARYLGPDNKKKLDVDDESCKCTVM